MPIHDWTRVDAGTFHNFHYYWVGELGRALNDGLLPPELYAMVEQHAGRFEPDVLTLGLSRPDPQQEVSGGVALAECPPQVELRISLDENDHYAAMRRTVVVRHRSGHRIVAMIEVLSPGNKDSEARFDQLVEKVVTAIGRGVHVMLIDLHPPRSFDPQGIHAAIWNVLGGNGYEQPPDRPLTLVSYRADV
ncbi:MAG: DUF4058 family protein, partial [Planctomycetaceae bacterium]